MGVPGRPLGLPALSADELGVDPEKAVLQQRQVLLDPDPVDRLPELGQGVEEHNVPLKLALVGDVGRQRQDLLAVRPLGLRPVAEPVVIEQRGGQLDEVARLEVEGDLLQLGEGDPAELGVDRGEVEGDLGDHVIEGDLSVGHFY